MNQLVLLQQPIRWHWTQEGRLWMHSCLVPLCYLRCIAVKWFLKVYWLLSLSIVDSFAEHRWILGPFNQLHFPKESFPYFNGLFFLHQLNQQTAWQKSYWINRHLLQDPPVFGWQNNHAELGSFVGPWNRYVLALLDDGHQWNGVSPLNGTLQERKR